MADGRHLKNFHIFATDLPILTKFGTVIVWALPSLSAINCTVTDNKTTNINDKNGSLSIVLTVMDQKLQKS